MAKVNKETLDRWFDYNVDIETRTIYMGSEEGVDALMAEYVVKGMHILESKSDEAIQIISQQIGRAHV